MPTVDSENRTQTQKEEESTVHLLEQSNFSRASTRREGLRQRLVARTAGPAPRPLFRPIWTVAGLAALVLLFLGAITSLLGSPTPRPGAVTQAVAATATPLPQKVVEPSPTPQIIFRLNELSSPDEVRIAIMEPSWATLWAELEMDTYSAPGASSRQPDTRVFNQVWLEYGKRGLVLASDMMAGEGSSNPAVDYLWTILFDGSSLTKVLTRSGAATQPLPEFNGALHPLELVSPPIQLIYPGFLAVLSSSPRVVRMDNLLGRQVLVADWGNSRLWVDTQTGLLLRAERYDGAPGESSLQSVLSMRGLGINALLNDSNFRLDIYTAKGPMPEPVATAMPGPTPTPWAMSSPQGWLYLLAAEKAPFAWKVYSLPAACLFEAEPCPEPQMLSDNPNIQIGGLAWSPDHSLAVFSNTNDNQIWSFEPKTRRWQPVLDGFFQMNLLWSPDGKLIAGTGEGDGAYDDRLVVIERSGWQVRDVPSSLKGNKEILGWLDGSSLAVLIRPVDSFKGGAPAWVKEFRPGLFKVDVNTGKDTLLVDEAAGAKGPRISPDGKQLGLVETNGSTQMLSLMSTDGTGWHMLGVEGSLPTWSPDGTLIAFERSQGSYPENYTVELQLIRPDSTGLRSVLKAAAPFEYLWSPDSKSLLIGVRDDAQPKIYLYSLDSGQIKQISLPVLTGAMAWNLLGWEP